MTSGLGTGSRKFPSGITSTVSPLMLSGICASALDSIAPRNIALAKVELGRIVPLFIEVK